MIAAMNPEVALGFLLMMLLMWHHFRPEGRGWVKGCPSCGATPGHDHAKQCPFKDEDWT